VKSIHESKERLIMVLLLGGVGLVLVGIFQFFFGIVLMGLWGFILGPILVVLGLAALTTGLAIGLGHNRAGKSAAGIRPQEEARVIARYAINDIGEMIFDNFDYDAPGARFYVRLQYLDGKREELETARAVFDQCGEGMRGLLTVQGNWLSQFVILVDTQETRQAYRGL
jgi:hypothetical protein